MNGPMRIRRLALGVVVVAASCAAEHAMSSEHTLVDLSGTIVCGPTTCGDGELCIDQFLDGSNGSNDGTYHYSCVPAPVACPLAASCSYDCSVRPGPQCCPTCVAELCVGIPSEAARKVSCVGF
jgi:hypothetical protein